MVYMGSRMASPTRRRPRDPWLHPSVAARAKMILRPLVVAAFGALAFGKPVRRSMQVHEARKSVPVGFTADGAAPADATLKLRLALVHNDDAGLIDTLYDVSTPSSANYGKHLSKEEASHHPSACHCHPSHWMRFRKEFRAARWL